VDADIPSDADYVTQTNPQRFTEVVEYAHKLIEQLLKGFVVERSAGDWESDFPRFGDWNDGCPAPVRLTPSAGVPLVFGFTSAPGVVLRVGPNVELMFPDCLCDACSYQVVDMCNELQRTVDAATSGGFTEGLNRRSHRWSLEVASGGRRASQRRLRRGEFKDLGARGKFRWAPWESAGTR